MARQVCWCRVTGIHVRLFDSRGALILSMEDTKQYMELNTGGEDGIGLSNGTYLAVFELCIDSLWTHAGVALLTILR